MIKQLRGKTSDNLTTLKEILKVFPGDFPRNWPVTGLSDDIDRKFQLNLFVQSDRGEFDDGQKMTSLISEFQLKLLLLAGRK